MAGAKGAKAGSSSSSSAQKDRAKVPRSKEDSARSTPAARPHKGKARAPDPAPSSPSEPTTKTKPTTSPTAAAATAKKSSSAGSGGASSSRPADPNAPTTTRLHVSGLNTAVSEADLRARFTSFGEVLAVDGWPAGKNALGDQINYAFLTLRTTHAKLSKCLSLLNNSAWKGSKLRIGEARPLFSEQRAKEAQAARASGWTPPARGVVEAKLKLEEGGAPLRLQDVLGQSPAGRQAVSTLGDGSGSSSSSSASSSSDDIDSADESGSTDHEEDGVNDDGDDQDGAEGEGDIEAGSQAPLGGEAIPATAGSNTYDDSDGSNSDANDTPIDEEEDEFGDDATAAEVAPSVSKDGIAHKLAPGTSIFDLVTRARTVPSAADAMGEVNDDEAEARADGNLDDDEALPAAAAGGFSILGGLALDDVQMDDEFDFDRIDGGQGAGTGAAAASGASGAQAADFGASIWHTSTTTGEDRDAMAGAPRRALPFLFPRFEGSGSGSGLTGREGPLRPVPDERNPAYRLLFRDLSEGITERSERVPPFCRTETLDEIEDAWRAKRRVLTQEYKRRHREAVKKQRRRVVGSRATGGVVGMRGGGGAQGRAAV